MKVYRELSVLDGFKNAVVTIGSFDGVHAGHQKILSRVKELARRLEGESVLITFHPHPRLVVNPDDDSLRLLTTIDEKIELLSSFGIDNLIIVPFTLEFSQQSPETYISDFLVKYFNPLRIVIGYDHRFGKGRAGDISLLKLNEDRYGFLVEEISKQEVDSIAVSSTKIRNALTNGKVAIAADLLKYHFRLTGEVVKGQALGRKLGFPTANIEVADRHKLIPREGIYAVRVEHAGDRFDGMLYIGTRPTIKSQNQKVIEVNIFDFDKDIYGEEITIEFVQKIREDKSFSGLEELKEQLIKDKANSMAILGSGSKKKMETELPKVAIVILNFNGVDFLRRFLPGVLLSDYGNLEVVVADNGSEDDSLDYLSAQQGVRIIALGNNHGFAGGYNLALEDVFADYFIILNSDVWVDGDWISPVIELMERDRSIAVCQPKILQYDQDEYFEYAGAAGGHIDALGYPFCKGRMFGDIEKDEGQYNDTSEVFWASGAAMFVRSDVFKGLGGFDADFFAHMEEIDFCWRVKRAGYKVMVRPKSVVHHVGGGTLGYESPFKVYLNFRNNLILLTKNENKSKLAWLLPLRLVMDGLAAFRFLLKGQFKNIVSIIRAHWHYFFKMGYHFDKRKKDIDAIQKVSIGRNEQAGRYSGSIVVSYFLKGKKRYRDL